MSFWDNVDAGFHAASRGAATVYHDVLATGAHITAWEHDPAVAPLLHVGVRYAMDALTRFGVPGGLIAVAVPDVLAALKSLAAADATVFSAGSSAGRSTAPAEEPPPPA